MKSSHVFGHQPKLQNDLVVNFQLSLCSLTLPVFRVACDRYGIPLLSENGFLCTCVKLVG